MAISKETQNFFKVAARMSEIQCDSQTLWNGEVGSQFHRALIDSMAMYFTHGYNAYLIQLLSLIPLELRQEVLAYIVTHTGLKPDLAKILTKGNKIIDSEVALEVARRTPIPLLSSVASQREAKETTKPAYLLAMLLKMEKQLDAGSLMPENDHVEKIFREFLAKIHANRTTIKAAAAEFWLDDQETSFSVKAISGGLPSLGKRSK